MNWKIWASTGSAAILGIIVGVGTLYAGQPSNIPASLTILALAAAAGWLIGVLFSPYGPNETKQFSEYAKIVSTAFGGYLVGKIDSLVSNLTRADFNDFLIARSAGAAAAFIISVLIVFSYRRYAGRIQLNL